MLFTIAEEVFVYEDNRNAEKLTMKRREYDLLKKFENGHEVDRNDEYEVRILDRYASIGSIRFGVSTQGGQTEETASLTERGRTELKLEEYSQKYSHMHPLKRKLILFFEPLFSRISPLRAK